MIKNILPKSEFTRNVLTLMTGTTIAQAIPIAISPILTRLYTPQDFGVFALFISITSILGSIANGRYELAIMLPKKDEDAINIVALGVIIAFVFSSFLFIIILIFHNKIIQLLNNQEISSWLYFVPLVVLLTGLYNVLNYWNNRKKEYKDLAKATVIKSIAGAIVQLILGFLKAGASGLVSGQIVSQFFANTKLLLNIIKDKALLANISKVKIITLSKKYKKFFIYDTWTAIVYMLYTKLIYIFLQKRFSSDILGYYFMAERLVQMPLSLIRNSISNVFYEKISKLNSLEIYKEANRLVNKLVILTLIPYSIIIYFAYIYIPLIFGKNWSELYKYIWLISLPAYISFISLPFSYVLKIISKQEISLFFHFIKLMFVISYFVFWDDLEFFEFLFYYIILDVFLMILFLNIQIYFLTKQIKFNLIYIIAFFGGGMLWFVKF